MTTAILHPAQRPLDAASAVLVTPQWIAAHMHDPDVRIVEVDVSSAAYDAGHIPGAVLWNIYADLRCADYDEIGAVELEALLSRSGITPSATVALYGYGAFLGFWLLKRYAHERAVVLDGPRERWEGAGIPWSSELDAPARSVYALAPQDAGIVATREAVVAAMTGAGAAILDVRSQAEFAGERFWPSGAAQDAGRPGHIPGAVHLPFELVRTAAGALREPAELRALLLERGVEAQRPIVTYCTIGNRASQVWFALSYVLGHPQVSVYYGSWVEWGRLSGTPVEP